MTATRTYLNGAVHPAAEIFPLIEGSEFDELVESIREHGLLEPVWALPSGVLLDGRNRVRACQRVGIVPSVRVYDGVDVVGFVVGLNLHRRHLSESQRAMVAARLTTTSRNAKESGSQRAGSQICEPLKTREDAANLVNVSANSVTTARRVLDEAPELAHAIDAGDIAVSAAADVARHAPDILPFVASGIIEPTEAVAEARERKKVHVTNNSGENEWYTPPKFIEAARIAMASIDIDPASSDAAQKTVMARKYYTAETNGLNQTWTGNVWLNPPYSQPLINQFIEKVTTEDISAAIVLVNNGTETAWGQRILSAADAVCFPRGRIKFHDKTGKPANTPLQGQMLVYIGDKPQRFASVFEDIGVVLYG